MRSEIRPFVIGLIVVQAAISASLWVLNATSVNSTAVFAVLLAADVLIFAGICHLAFFTGDAEDERAMYAALDEVSAGKQEVGKTDSAHENPHAPQPLIEVPTVLSRSIRTAVPIASAAMLLLLAILVGSGRGSTADFFIPVFIFMVVVYVLSSIYLFKAIFEREKATALPAGGEGHQADKEDHS